MREGQNTKAARRLRKHVNAPEAVAWNALRQLRGNGVAVRRQHPIGPFIVDFAIVRRKIVIEIDGGVHRLDEVAMRDGERQAALEALGWRVIRVEAGAAMNADYLLALLQRELGL
jgi:very-short-patch-repair endonuclease